MKTRLSRRDFLKASAHGALIAGFTGVTGHGDESFANSSEISQTKNPSQWIATLIEDFTLTSPLNTLKIKAGEKE